MDDSTLITMRKDVLYLLLQRAKSEGLQERNIQSLTELVEARRVNTKIKFTVTKGGKYHE